MISGELSVMISGTQLMLLLCVSSLDMLTLQVSKVGFLGIIYFNGYYAYNWGMVYHSVLPSSSCVANRIQGEELRYLTLLALVQTVGLCV